MIVDTSEEGEDRYSAVWEKIKCTHRVFHFDAALIGCNARYRLIQRSIRFSPLNPVQDGKRCATGYKKEKECSGQWITVLLPSRVGTRSCLEETNKSMTPPSSHSPVPDSMEAECKMRSPHLLKLYNVSAINFHSA